MLEYNSPFSCRIVGLAVGIRTANLTITFQKLYCLSQVFVLRKTVTFRTSLFKVKGLIPSIQ